jgi:CRP/FNR family cyclic AMP-dependent transcriptional regulator
MRSARIDGARDGGAPEGGPPGMRRGTSRAGAWRRGDRSMTENLLPILVKHPFVQNLDPPQVARLATLAKEVEFAADEIIFREGDQDPELYLIVKGMVAIEIDTPEHLIRVQTLDAGDEFGWSAVMMGKGKHFQARALEAVKALQFNGAELLAAFKSDPALGFAFTLKLLGVVSERFQAARMHLVDKYSPVAKRAGN